MRSRARSKMLPASTKSNDFAKSEAQPGSSRISEDDAIVLSTLMAEYSIRSQEILNIQSEVNKWDTGYITALVAIIGWIIKDIPNSSLDDFLAGRNGYLILIAAILNTFFFLSFTQKSFHVWALYTYLFLSLTTRIRAITNDSFNDWGEWSHKLNRGTPRLVNLLYRGSIAILPLFISMIILGLYGRYLHTHPSVPALQKILYWLAMANLAVAVFFTIVPVLETAYLKRRFGGNKVVES